MIRIAIVDDEQEMLGKVRVITTAYMESKNLVYEVVTYTKSGLLLFDLEDNKLFDIFLLDIEMPKVTGLDLARSIREYSNNAIIIFITSYIQYAIDSFELSIFRYIPKWLLEKKLPRSLEEAVSLINIGDNKMYTISTSNRFEKILYKDILYIYKESKNSVIRNTNGESRTRKSLKQVFEELAASEFIFIDRGYIVNIVNIMKVENDDIILKNGEKIPMSRSRKQDVIQLVNSFWRKNI